PFAPGPELRGGGTAGTALYPLPAGYNSGPVPVLAGGVMVRPVLDLHPAGPTPEAPARPRAPGPHSVPGGPSRPGSLGGFRAPLASGPSAASPLAHPRQVGVGEALLQDGNNIVAEQRASQPGHLRPSHMRQACFDFSPQVLNFFLGRNLLGQFLFF